MAHNEYIRMKRALLNLDMLYQYNIDIMIVLPVTMPTISRLDIAALNLSTDCVHCAYIQ